MMYLPPYPVYLTDQHGAVTKAWPRSKKTGKMHSCKRIHVCQADEGSIGVQLEKLLFKDSCYLIIAVIIICITERDSLSKDPLNYKVVNIVFEVVSAYGNVGLSMGYSCSLFRKLVIHSAEHCEEVVYSFSGKWSVEGKVVIIMVMFLGRLKAIKRNSCMFPNFTSKIYRHIQMLKIINKSIPAHAPCVSDEHGDQSMNTLNDDTIKEAMASPKDAMMSSVQ